MIIRVDARRNCCMFAGGTYAMTGRAACACMTIFLIAPPINLDPTEEPPLLPSVMVYMAVSLQDTTRQPSGEARIGGNHSSKGSRIEVYPIRTLKEV